MGILQLPLSPQKTARPFGNLKRWVNKITRQCHNPDEITEELAVTLEDYRQYIKIHQMKTKKTWFELLLVGGATLIENLVKLQFSSIANGFFSFKQQRIALLEAELKAPGREVAYICKAESAFRTQR
jgi:hypothetical protein